MAAHAQVVVSHHRASVASAAAHEDEEEAAHATENLDTSGEGHISAKEIQNKIKYVAVRADMLYERIVLERELAGAMLKLLNFFVYTGCFLIACGTVEPSASTSSVHSFLYSHFMLDQVSQLKDFGALYKYMEDFEHANEKVQATSAMYWCESRYYELGWDFHSETPAKSCASPRMYVLYGNANNGVPWCPEGEDCGHGSSGGHGSSSDGHGSSSGGGHRRMSSRSNERKARFNRSLSSLRRLGGGGGGTAHVIGECVDDDEGLRHAMHTESFHGHKLTCAEDAAMVCKEEAGLIHCKKSCGYCAPFKYERMHKFTYPIVSMLPAMVYQERYNLKPCHGYAESYLHQPSNPALIILPTLDGTRNDDLVSCVDRESEYAEEYAHKVECPMCEGGWHYDTQVHHFHGVPVYPKFLVEAHKDIEIMKSIGWIDVQTKELVLSTSLYTEGAELFTFLAITFTIDEAGGINGQYKMTTIKDLVGDDKSRFVLFVFLTMGFVGVAWIRSCCLLVYNNKHDGTPLSSMTGQVLEILTQTLLLSFTIALFIGWTQQELVHVEFDEMLHSFLELRELSHDAFSEVVDHFFEVKTHVYYTTAWYSRHRVVAYMVIYGQFIQLILYFNVHPRMAVLTHTIQNGLDHMVHFLLLFSILFGFLAFMAHWMFGPDLDIFQTMMQTISEQVRILFGEYLVAGEGMKNLSGRVFGIYVLYFITFMFIVSWTLLNFFLAIVVDAFVIVKEEIGGAGVHKNFFVDVVDAFMVFFHYRTHRWPSYKKLKTALDKVQRYHKDGTRKTAKENSIEEEETADPSCEPLLFWRDIRGMFEHDQHAVLGTREGAISFICYYGAKCNSIIRVNTDSGTSVQRSASSVSEAESSKTTANAASSTSKTTENGASSALKLPPVPDSSASPPPDDDEIKLTKKESILFEASMKGLVKAALKYDTIPDGSDEAMFDAMIANCGVSIVRELQQLQLNSIPDN